MTSNPKIDIGINIGYMIVLGAGKQPKTGKHTLLTMIELISLRYYSLFYLNIQNKII